MNYEAPATWEKAQHMVDYQYAYPRANTLQVVFNSTGEYKLNLLRVDQVSTGGGSGGSDYWAQGYSNSIYSLYNLVGIGTNDPQFMLDVAGIAQMSGLIVNGNVLIQGNQTINGNLNGQNATFSGQVQAATGYFGAILDSYGNAGLQGQTLVIDATGKLQWMNGGGGGVGDGHEIQDNGLSLPQRDILNIIGNAFTLTDDPANDATILEIKEQGYIGQKPADTSAVLDGQVMVFDATLNTFVPIYLGVSGSATPSGIIQKNFTTTAANQSFNILVDRDSTQNRPTVEVLKRVAGTAQNLTLYDFTATDLTNFTYGNQLTAYNSNLGLPYQFNFGYAAAAQSITLGAGDWTFEVWGARGGPSAKPSSGYVGGAGGYTVGDLALAAPRTFYVYTGQDGNSGPVQPSYTFNGGGGGYTSGYGNYSGGGATDIRLTGGTWNDAASLRSRIIVAGGGPGGQYALPSGSLPGAGGGLNGVADGGNLSIPGGQVPYTSAGAQYGTFGLGAHGAGGWSYSGAGGGYYGGGVSTTSPYASSGGSGFASGCVGCIAVKSAADSTPKDASDPTRNIHYSGLTFTNSQLYNGKQNFPNTSTGNETGHQGAGAARITRAALDSTPQLVVQNADIDLSLVDNIGSLAYTTTLTGTAQMRVVASPDRGATWYTTADAGATWTPLTSLTAANVLSQGIPVAAFNALNNQLWNIPGLDTGYQLRLAFALQTNTLTDVANVDKLTFSYVSQESWIKATQNTDYTYTYTNPQNLNVKFVTAGAYKVNITYAAATSGGTGLWMSSGTTDDIYRLDGNVGIGTTTVDSTNKLQVQGNTQISGELRLGTTGRLRYNEILGRLEYSQNSGTTWFPFTSNSSSATGSGSISSASTTFKMLPNTVTLANDMPQANGLGAITVVDDYVYLIGGRDSVASTSHALDTIYRAPLTDPTNLSLYGTLPYAIDGFGFAVIDGYAYIFGGSGTAKYTKILRAPLTQMNNWQDTGANTPEVINWPSVQIVGDRIYIYNGHNATIYSNMIMSAPVSNPLAWQVETRTFPISAYGKVILQVGDYLYSYGGHNGSTGVNVYYNTIYRAPVSDPTNFTLVSGKTLPTPSSFSSLSVVGDQIYFMGGYYVSGTTSVYQKQIWQASIYDPTTVIDTRYTLPTGTGYTGPSLVANNKLYQYGGVNTSNITSFDIIGNCDTAPYVSTYPFHAKLNSPDPSCHASLALKTLNSLAKSRSLPTNPAEQRLLVAEELNLASTDASSSSASSNPSLIDLSTQLADLATAVGAWEQALGLGDIDLEDLVQKIKLIDQVNLEMQNPNPSASNFAWKDFFNLGLDGALEITPSVHFLNEVRFGQAVTFDQTLILATDSAGELVISAGSDSAVHQFSQPYAKKPIVNITPTQSLRHSFWVEEISPAGFKVKLNKPIDGSGSAVLFNWTAAQTQ